MAARKGAAKMVSAPPASAHPKTRFFVEPDKLTKDRAILTGSAYHHTKNVLRMKPGAELFVFDGAGREALGVLEEFQGETGIVRILSDTATSTSAPLTGPRRKSPAVSRWIERNATATAKMPGEC